MKWIVVFLVTVSCLAARIGDSRRPDRLFDWKTHDINNLEMMISNIGIFGQSQWGDVGCWWPTGSGHNYIYGAGIWFGTIDPATHDTLVTISYGPHGGECEVGPGLTGMLVNDSMAIIYMYPTPWPAPAGIFPMAPQSRISHQDSWCCFNDGDPTNHMPGDTRPIEIEVYQTVYAWNIMELADMIFFTHTVKNVSDHTLEDCYLGVVTDCDIGNEAAPSANDRIAGIVGRWYVVNSESIWVDNLAYQWQEAGESGWSEFPGAIAFDLLGTPGDLGMTALKRFTLDVEPNIDAERYATLAGYNFQAGTYEPYDTMPSPPDDQRFLMASGPFDLAVDSTVTMVFAVLCAYWYDIFGSADTALVLVDKWAQYQYDNDWVLSLTEATQPRISMIPMAINPNPVTNNATIAFSLSRAGFVSLKIYNTLGQSVQEIIKGYSTAGDYTINLNTQGLAQGTYLLRLKAPDAKSSRPFVVLH